jgi:hypothetical protein
VARTTRAGEIYPGAICQYALGEFDGDRLALTRRGVELAEIENPILDGDVRLATSTLSKPEAEFFIREVQELVPGELRDFAFVVSAMAASQVTPESLFAAVRTSLPLQWSDQMARTHVSGLVARMAEMSLVRRKWEGRNVQYELQPAASGIKSEEVGT